VTDGKSENRDSAVIRDEVNQEDSGVILNTASDYPTAVGCTIV